MIEFVTTAVQASQLALKRLQTCNKALRFNLRLSLMAIR